MFQTLAKRKNIFVCIKYPQNNLADLMEACREKKRVRIGQLTSAQEYIIHQKLNLY